MKKYFKPLIFICTIIATIVASSGCKKCIICTVKDVNSNKVLYISPEKCGKEADFTALQDSVDKAYNCWGCAIYDSVYMHYLDSVYPTNMPLSQKLDSTYIMSLDSFALIYSQDTLDSIKCGSIPNLIKHKNLTTKLVRQYTNNAYYLRCDSAGFPSKSECD